MNHKNLVIKHVDEDEFESFFRLVDKNRQRLVRYFPNTMMEIQHVDQARVYLKACESDRIAKTRFAFGVYVNEKLSGWISIKNIETQIKKCELGYYMDASCQGQGHMSRTLDEILRFSFQTLKMNKIFLRIDKKNLGSIRVAEKAGFLHEGSLREEFKIETGKLIDVEYFGILERDWICMNGAPS